MIRRNQILVGGHTNRATNTKAIVIKPIESVYLKVDSAQRAKQRPVSQLGLRDFAQQHHIDTKKERSASHRKGLFQIELEKSNKENLSELAQPWVQPTKYALNSKISRKGEKSHENSMRPGQKAQPQFVAPEPKLSDTTDFLLSEESLLISNAVEEYRQAAETELSPCFNWRLR